MRARARACVGARVCACVRMLPRMAGSKLRTSGPQPWACVASHTTGDHCHCHCLASAQQQHVVRQALIPRSGVARCELDVCVEALEVGIRRIALDGSSERTCETAIRSNPKMEWLQFCKGFKGAFSRLWVFFGFSADRLERTEELQPPVRFCVLDHRVGVLQRLSVKQMRFRSMYSNTGFSLLPSGVPRAIQNVDKATFCD